MHPLQTFAETLRWAGQDTAYNLGFIPADRFQWKPAPSAKSAAEIVNHLLFSLHSMLPVLNGGEWQHPDFTEATGPEDAAALLTAVSEEYADKMLAIPAADLSRDVKIWGHYHTWLGRAATMPVVDTIHHRGQIVYIQTLLGDVEDHFTPL